MTFVIDASKCLLKILLVSLQMGVSAFIVPIIKCVFF